MGGLRAVVYADMVQGTWLIVSSIVLTTVAFVAVGGWHGLTARVDPGLLHMVKCRSNPNFPSPAS